jgi:predicted component of type VI protein secretion system
MSDNEVHKIIDKLQKLRALREARDRVKQLESELYGAAARSQDPPAVPEFLSLQQSLHAV